MHRGAFGRRASRIADGARMALRRMAGGGRAQRGTCDAMRQSAAQSTNVATRRDRSKIIRVDRQMRGDRVT
ncbi:hypothetical protein WS86_01815 [Burkholderia savannae]|nr:hypothetical protein WS86_01815 [Burkholderia savannae]